VVVFFSLSYREAQFISSSGFSLTNAERRRLFFSLLSVDAGMSHSAKHNFWKAAHVWEMFRSRATACGLQPPQRPVVSHISAFVFYLFS